MLHKHLIGCQSDSHLPPREPVPGGDHVHSLGRREQEEGWSNSKGGLSGTVTTQACSCAGITHMGRGNEYASHSFLPVWRTPNLPLTGDWPVSDLKQGRHQGERRLRLMADGLVIISPSWGCHTPGFKPFVPTELTGRGT